MLTAIAHQVMEYAIRLSVSDDSTELTELLEDVEEEQENEDKPFVIQDSRSEKSVTITEKVLVNIPSEMLCLDVHKKIPVPPPEIV